MEILIFAKLESSKLLSACKRERERDRLASQWVNYREIDATVSRGHVGPHPDRFGRLNTCTPASRSPRYWRLSKNEVLNEE